MEFGEINGAEQSSTRAGRFSEFIQLFYMLGKHEKLFPKICRTCGTEYHSFSEFLQGTRPLAHGLQDASEVMHTPYTLQYRNCTCGSTLVLSLTAETYPELDEFWNMLQEEAACTGQSLSEVVLEFREQCNRYILDRILKED